MADEVLGASFNIDVSSLKTGLAQANRLIRESNSEFKAAAAGLDDWAQSEEGLTAKLKNLNDVQDLQAKKVSALQEEYDKCIAEGLDPMSAAAVKMRTDINNEKAALEKTKSEITKYQDALDDLADSSDDAGDSVEDVGESAKDAGDGFTIAKGAIADFISDGIQNLIGSCKDAISSIAGLADSTRESRTEFSKLEASFESAGLGAKSAEKTMSDLYGILGDTGQATEASNLLAKMSKDQEDLDKNTRILTGVFAEYGDSIPTEGLAEAMSSTAAMGEVQGVLADALEWQGVNLDGFNEKLAALSTEEERASLIQFYLTGLYGKSADAYRENNKELIEANEAQLDYEQTLNRFGEKVEPITTTVKEGFNSLLQKVLELVEDVDLDAFATKVEEAFGTFIDDILPKIVEGLEWIMDNKDTIIAGIVGIGAAFAAFKVVSLIQGVVTAMNGMTVAQYALNLAMSLNPIGLIVAAVAGLVAAFIVLWKKCDGFREFWINLWEGIKNAFSAVVEWLKENWKTLVLFLMNPIAGLFKYFYDHFEGFRNFVDNFCENIKNFFLNLWEGIKGIFSTIGTWVNDNVIQPILSFVQPFIDFIVDLVRVCWEIIAALWGVAASWFNKKVIVPVRNFFKDLWEKVSGFFKQLWADIKGIWSSVSTWFDTNVVQPIANFFSNLWSGLKETAADAWKKIKEVFEPVGDFFGGIWDTIKEKFTTIGTKVADAIGGAFKSAINSVITVVENTLNTVPKAINKFLDKINQLPGVNISDLSTISLPRLAKGGVVRGATNAIIGEDGAEAIVPLERNTEWIDKVADQLASKQKSIVVNQTNNYSQAHSRYELYKSKQQTSAAVRLALMKG